MATLGIFDELYTIQEVSDKIQGISKSERYTITEEICSYPYSEFPLNGESFICYSTQRKLTQPEKSEEFVLEGPDDYVGYIVDTLQLETYCNGLHIIKSRIWVELSIIREAIKINLGNKLGSPFIGDWKSKIPDELKLGYESRKIEDEYRWSLWFYNDNDDVQLGLSTFGCITTEDGWGMDVEEPKDKYFLLRNLDENLETHHLTDLVTKLNNRLQGLRHTIEPKDLIIFKPLPYSQLPQALHTF